MSSIYNSWSIYAYVIGWGSDAECLLPKDLRLQIRETALRMVSKYSGREIHI
jgi:predicted DNA-binding transcriptional regulator YafY